MSPPIDRGHDVAPRWVALRIDESGYWAPSLVRQARRIFGVYICDMNARTYACSATPFYALHYVTSIPEVVPDLPESSANLAEFIEEQGTWSDDLVYLTCASVDAQIGDGSIEIARLDTPPDWREEKDRGFEQVLEDYQGTPRF